MRNDCLTKTTSYPWTSENEWYSHNTIRASQLNTWILISIMYTYLTCEPQNSNVVSMIRKANVFSGHDSVSWKKIESETSAKRARKGVGVGTKRLLYRSSRRWPAVNEIRPFPRPAGKLLNGSRPNPLRRTWFIHAIVRINRRVNGVQT